MDFAENYQCQTMNEIQSAYWNQTMVTLHSIVIYYVDESGNLSHKSYIFVSDELGHNAGSVQAILKTFLPKLKETVPGTCFVHYWTDSPTSQYRYKLLFKFLSDHEENFGIKAAWNYFEAGHGKGPCDGVGGTAKRMADEAVRAQKTVIQDAHDFYCWATMSKSPSIEYIFISKEECMISSNYLNDMKSKILPVRGTMKLHAAVGLPGNQLFTRNTSCYCEDCFGMQGFNMETKCIWQKHQILNDLIPQDDPGYSMLSYSEELDHKNGSSIQFPSDGFDWHY